MTDQSTTTTATATPAATPGAEGTTQVFRIYIHAKPERVWEAITSPEFSRQYGYGGDVEFDLTPGGTFRHTASDDMKRVGMPDVVVTGRVLECDPPRRLVQTWNPVWNDEPETTLTYEIEPAFDGTTRLTLVHELTGAPSTALEVSGNSAADQHGAGGWPWVLSGLKSALERA
ncbi:SRPBCC family protein [Pedococcus sp. 2YAF34]|uniref:SRPBCC family protein n=1 Tax=Pedococcus sp. 2YAF34 TaxID=3233032 RepID=UPI003F9E2BDE